ncbi:MAG: pectin acetylesterase-family hydrolase [Pseudomonadota bacterium]
MPSEHRPVFTLTLLSLSLAALFVGGCATPAEDSAPVERSASVAPERPDWQQIAPGGATGCSDGSDFVFYARPGDPEKLVFFLQGGGACWNLETCDPLGWPSYTVNLDNTHPSRSDGIFNFARPDNPFADHSVVFVPYCSADVHIGAARRTYERSANWRRRLIDERERSADEIDAQFTVEHRGFANVAAALDWTDRNVPAPRSVFVTGSSAGSIPSPYYALLLSRRYPEARITQLGDGSGGYRRLNESASPQVTWDTLDVLGDDPAYADVDSAEFDFETLYTHAKTAEPRLRLHAYDTAEDDVQLRFLSFSGIEGISLKASIDANQADIRAADPAFRSFIAAGELHTILRRPEFYTYAVGQRSVRDWVADVAAGRAVESVSCTVCDPE